MGSGRYPRNDSVAIAQYDKPAAPGRERRAATQRDKLSIAYRGIRLAEPLRNLHHSSYKNKERELARSLLTSSPWEPVYYSPDKLQRKKPTLGRLCPQHLVLRVFP